MAATKKLYYEDVFCTQFCARVLSCVPKGANFAVTLDATAFYPEGGGQPADRGALGGARVLDVHEQDGEIIHIVTAPLRKGELVQGDVDKMRRLDHMQQHTGEHIMSGIIHAQYGYENVGFHIGEEEVTVDFSGPLTWEELIEAERAANWVVWNNAPVTVSWPTPEKLAQMSYRSKKELTGPVRIVQVGDTDVCACCGTHVDRCGPVGIIKITGVQSYKGGVRVTMRCGMRAARDYKIKFENAMAVSGALSAKIDEIPAAVERLKAENAALKAQKTAVEDAYFAALAEAKRGQENALVFVDGIAPDGLRRLCEALVRVCPGVCVVFSGGEETGYRYAVGGAGDVRGLVKEMNGALNGRGGGKGIQQGSVEARRAAVEAFFAERE